MTIDKYLEVGRKAGRMWGDALIEVLNIDVEQIEEEAKCDVCLRVRDKGLILLVKKGDREVRVCNKCFMEMWIGAHKLHILLKELGVEEPQDKLTLKREEVKKLLWKLYDLKLVLSGITHQRKVLPEDFGMVERYVDELISIVDLWLKIPLTT